MTTNLSDADALTRYARSADAEAFAALVRRYESLVFGVCVRQLGRGADAEDAAQLTFVKLARAAATIQNRLEGTLGAWLHTTAARTALDLGRQRSTRRKHEAAAAQAAADERAARRDEHAELGLDDSAWGTAALAELSAEVDAALAELPEAQRVLIVEVFFRGRTQRQVAKTTGKCQARVCRELKAAVEALRAALNKRGVMVPSAGLLAGLAGLRDAAAGSLGLGSAVPEAVTAGCVKVGLAGVGGSAGLGISGGTLGPGASVSTAWPAFWGGTASASGWRSVGFWVLVGLAMLGLGLAIWGIWGGGGDGSVAGSSVAAVSDAPQH